MEDAQGVVRGGCRECSCRRYVMPTVNRCDYCNHLPIHHEELAQRQVATDDAASSSSASNGNDFTSPRTKSKRASDVLQHHHQHQPSSASTGRVSSMPPDQPTAASLLAYVKALKRDGVLQVPGTSGPGGQTGAGRGAPGAAPTGGSQETINELLTLLRAQLNIPSLEPHTLNREMPAPALPADTGASDSALEASVQSSNAVTPTIMESAAVAPRQPSHPPQPLPARTPPVTSQSAPASQRSSTSYSMASTPQLARPRTAPISNGHTYPPTVPPASSHTNPPGLAATCGTYSVSLSPAPMPPGFTPTTKKTATLADGKLKKNRTRKRGPRATRSRSKLGNDVGGLYAEDESDKALGQGDQPPLEDDEQSLGYEGSASINEGEEDGEEYEAGDRDERELKVPMPTQQLDDKSGVKSSTAPSPADPAEATAASESDIRRNTGVPRRRIHEKPEELIPLAFLHNPHFAPPQHEPFQAAEGVPETKRVRGKGTGDPKYSITLIACANKTLIFHPITAMPAYRQKSFEELRWEDYGLGNRGNQAQPSLFSLIDVSEQAPYSVPQLSAIPLPSTLPSPSPPGLSAPPSLEFLQYPSHPPYSLSSPYSEATPVNSSATLNRPSPGGQPVQLDKGKEKEDERDVTAATGVAVQDEDEERIIYGTPTRESLDTAAAKPQGAGNKDSSPSPTAPSAQLPRPEAEAVARLHEELKELVEQLGKSLSKLQEADAALATTTSDGEAMRHNGEEISAILRRINNATRDYGVRPTPESRTSSISPAAPKIVSRGPPPPSMPTGTALPTPLFSSCTPFPSSLATEPIAAGFEIRDGTQSVPGYQPLSITPSPAAPVFPSYPSPASAPFALRTFPIPGDSSGLKRYYIKGSFVPFIEDFAHEFKDVARNKKEHYYAIINHPKLETNIIAFLNSKDGGTLYFGIHDSGQVIGVTITRDQLDTLKNVIWSKMETFNPVPDPHLYRIEMVPICNPRGTAIIKDLYVVEIHITGGTRLYFNREDRAWVRRDAGNHWLKSGTEVRDFIEQRKKERRYEKRGEKRSIDTTRSSGASTVSLSGLPSASADGNELATSAASQPMTPRRSASGRSRVAQVPTVQLFPLVRPMHKDGKMAPVWRSRGSSAGEGTHDTSNESDDASSNDQISTTKKAKRSSLEDIQESGEFQTTLTPRDEDNHHEDMVSSAPAENSGFADEDEHKDDPGNKDDSYDLESIPMPTSPTASTLTPPKEDKAVLPADLEEKFKELDTQMERLSAETTELISLTWLHGETNASASSEPTASEDQPSVDHPEMSRKPSIDELLGDPAGAPEQTVDEPTEHAPTLHAPESEDAKDVSSDDREYEQAETNQSANGTAVSSEPKSADALSEPRDAAQPPSTLANLSNTQTSQTEDGDDIDEQIVLPPRTPSPASGSAAISGNSASLPPFSFADFSSSFFSSFSLPAEAYSHNYNRKSTSYSPSVFPFTYPSSSTSSSANSIAASASSGLYQSPPASTELPADPDSPSIASFLRSSRLLGKPPHSAPSSPLAVSSSSHSTTATGFSSPLAFLLTPPRLAGSSSVSDTVDANGLPSSSNRPEARTSGHTSAPAGTGREERKMGKNRRKKERLRREIQGSFHQPVQATSGSNSALSEPYKATNHDLNETNAKSQVETISTTMEEELTRLESELEEDRKQFVAEFATFFSELAIRERKAEQPQ